MKKLLFGFLAIIILGQVIALTMPPETRSTPVKGDPEWTVDVMAMRALKASMHDPNSFELIKVLRMDDKSLCIFFRARNGFNAVRQNQAVIGPNSAAWTGHPNFANLWNRHCGNKRGEDISHISYAM